MELEDKGAFTVLLDRSSRTPIVWVPRRAVPPALLQPPPGPHPPRPELPSAAPWWPGHLDAAALLELRAALGLGPSLLRRLGVLALVVGWSLFTWDLGDPSRPVATVLLGLPTVLGLSRLAETPLARRLRGLPPQQAPDVRFNPDSLDLRGPHHEERITPPEVQQVVQTPSHLAFRTGQGWHLLRLDELGPALQGLVVRLRRLQRAAADEPPAR